MLFNPTLDVFLSKNHATNKGKTVGRYQFDTHPTGIGLSICLNDQTVESCLIDHGIYNLQHNEKNNT